MTKRQEKELRRRVGVKLRELRGFLSQAMFARHVKITQAQISQYERGDAMPGGLALVKLALFAGLDLAEIVRIAREVEDEV